MNKHSADCTFCRCKFLANDWNKYKKSADVIVAMEIKATIQ